MSDHPPCRVLIVEDESIVVADLKRDLEDLGHKVVGIADRGCEAIRLADETVPDLILMDIRLPGGMDGIDTAIQIQRQRHTPIIFVTANSSEATLTRAREAEPIGYISKPFRREELNATITIALHQHVLARQLFDEHSWLKVMLSSIRDGVIATDARGFVRYLNSEAEKLTGWLRDDAEGRPIEQVYKLGKQERASVQKCVLRQALEMGIASPRTTSILRAKSGGMLTIEDAATPIFNETGALAGAVAVFHDITSRQQAENERERLMRELKRSNDELSRFSYSVAHDLQIPARTIGALSQVLLRQLSTLEPEEAHVLDMIVGAAGQMQTLITSLLGFAQVSQGELKRETVHIEEVMEELRISLHSLIEETGAVITLDDVPDLVADRALLERVFQNLIANGIHYRRQGVEPVILISGESTDAGWSLSVSDNGVGIPADALERIFEPLHRLHGQELPGSGLGLALCRAIIARHGGRIWAQSEGSDKGATFLLFLPRDSGQLTIEADGGATAGA